MTQACSIPFRSLHGRHLEQAFGTSKECDRHPAAVLELLNSLARSEEPNAWFVAGTFLDGHRQLSKWESASALVLDLDYEDPEIPKDEGPHMAMPCEYRSKVLEALQSYARPGFAYATPRGWRVVHVLSVDVNDLEEYADLVDAARSGLLAHLESRGVATWRQGHPGLRLDQTSQRPSQAMRLPLPGQPQVLFGSDRPVDAMELLHDPSPRLDLDESLPSELAKACRRVGVGFQNSPEVVVTGFMAIACTLIGNSRWIRGWGRDMPLSLHYLTVQPSGSGKSTIRSFHLKAIAPILHEVRLLRKDAERAEAKYQAEVRSRSRKSKRESSVLAAPEPSPPPKSARGGVRATVIVTEATIEGLIDTLNDSPRGVLWACNEAHQVLGMLGHFSDSSTGRSLDAARLRSLMDSDPVEAHRAKSNVTPMRSVEVPWLAIDADVQPGVIEGLFTGEDLVSGMSARWLLHEPPSMRGRRKYVDAPAPPGEEESAVFRSYLEPLWRIELELVEDRPSPVCLELELAAARLAGEEMERMEARYDHVPEPLAGTLGHARGRLLRLAGVLALLRDPETMVVGEVDVQRAIHHLRYHLAHAERLLVRVDHGREEERLVKLDKSARVLLAHQPTRGVSPRDLCNRVSKRLYAGAEGRRRAVADLCKLGWTPRRPEWKGTGRKPRPSWFPRDASPNAGAIEVASRAANPSVGSVGTSRAPGATNPTAHELLEQASQRLLSSGEIKLPPPGKRGACPACGSSDGLAEFPPGSGRWHCHSDKHLDGGCAIDLLLWERLRRRPTPVEAVQEAKRILGLDAAA